MDPKSDDPVEFFAKPADFERWLRSMFHDGAWLSNRGVSWGCCDRPIVTTFKLPK